MSRNRVFKGSPSSGKVVDLDNPSPGSGKLTSQRPGSYQSVSLGKNNISQPVIPLLPQGPELHVTMEGISLGRFGFKKSKS